MNGADSARVRSEFRFLHILSPPSQELTSQHVNQNLVRPTAVACWIEEFYNRQRLHSKLGMVPPVEHELSLRAQKEPAEMKEEALTQAA